MRLGLFALLALTQLAPGATFLSEDFSTDPFAGGRFDQLLFGTESSFTYDSTNKNLIAVLDVDYDAAYYLSAPFVPVTDNDDVSFSFNFRIQSMDTRVLPTAFIGLLTTNHVALSGYGLTAVLSSLTNGLPAVIATVYQGPANFGGEPVPLAFATDYLAIGHYGFTNRQFAVDVYSGSNFINFVGRSITFATNTLHFSADRIGLQNSGGQANDYTNGSISLLVDNFFIPARPPVNLSINTNVVVDEGNSGTNTALFTVSLSSPSVQTVRVDYATVGLTATAGVDFLPQSGTLVFPPGTNSLTIAIPVLANVVAQPNRTFQVLLTNAINANLLLSAATGTIRDDDACLISVTDAAVSEVLNNSTGAVFTISLNLSNSQTVSVLFATADSTATAAGGDYIATNRLITFDPGVISQTCAVTVLGDTLDEPNEIFLVNLSSPTNALLGRSQGQCTITNTSPLPTVSLDLSTNVTEGSVGNTAVSAAFHLAPASGKTVTISYATSNDTAIAGSDYQAANGTVTFNPGQTNATAPLTILADRLHENTESFFVQITSVTNANLGNSTETITIFDDDRIPAIEILDTGIIEGNTGTNDAIFLVRLSNPTIDTVWVNFATSNGTALAGIDYLATNGTLTWLPGATNSQPVPVPVIGDLFNEADETFTLVLDTPVNATFARSQALCTITNDDFVSVSISDEQVVEGNGGSTTVTFHVTMSGPSVQQVTLSYFTKDGTATFGRDYVANSGILNFTTNTTQSIDVSVLGDTGDEPDETFFVVLTNLSNATFSKQIGTGTIIDDDPPAISIDNIGLDEGNSGTNYSFFTLRLSSASTNTISVDFFTADGSATAAGNDYLSTNGTIRFNPGETIATIPVAIIGDTNYEGDETFSMNLTNAQNATFITSQGTCAITNDDNSPFVYINDIIVLEGGCTNFTVTLSEPSTLEVTFHYCLTIAPTNLFVLCGTNCIGNDPTNFPATCRAACCTFVIPPGVISTNITICADDNLIDEDEITFKGKLSVEKGGRGDPAGGGGGGVLQDNDLPVIIIPRPAAAAGVVEGDSGTTNLVFTLRLTTRHDTNVFVDFSTLDGTATSGIDYIATNGTVEFLPGVKTQYVSVLVKGDVTYEPDETLFLVLTNVRNGMLTNTVLTGIITNDDRLPSLSINNITVLEGDSGTTPAEFTVSVLSPTDIGITVNFTTIDGTASNGFDYVSSSGAISFPPGVTNQTISVLVNGDTFDEPDETFFVRLSNPVNAILATTNGICTIRDDDPPEIRSSNPDTVEGNIGATNVLLFVLTLSTTNAEVVTVDFLTLDGTATAGLDYIATNGTITFLPGETNKTIPVAVLGDVLTEFNETVFLCLTNPVKGTLATPKATGTILDDDAPCISITNVVVQELTDGPTNAVFLVTLDYASSLEVSVSYSTSNGTAIAGSDYVGKSGTLIFSSGITTQSIVIPVSSDLDVETNETFVLNLFNVANGRLCRSQAIGTILDGTIAPLLSITNAVVVEPTSGSTGMVFTAFLSRASPQAVSVGYSTLDAGAVAGTDYVATTGILTFLPGVTATNFVIAVLSDCTYEPNETFFVRLTNVQFAALATNSVIGTIIDDDPPPMVFMTNVSVKELDLGTTNAVFNLWLSCKSSFTACVDYVTVDGTATAPGDYISTAGTVCFAPGITNATITIPVKGDFESESNETFFVDISNPQGAIIGIQRAVGTIIDDDGITVRIAPGSANEGNAIRFILTLSKPPSSLRTLNFTTFDDTATSGLDYVGTNVLVQFPAGITLANVDVLTLSDTIDEPNETFFARLSNPFNLDFENAEAIGTIIDGNPPCIRVEDTSVRDNGTGNQTVSYPVTLSSASSLQICVNFYTTNGTAIAGPDYIATSGTLCFPPGSTNGEVLVKVLPNTRDETNEFFYVILYGPNNATVCKPIATGTIINPLVSNAPPIVTLTFPEPGLCLTLPTNLTVVADAHDPDGKVNRVEFFENYTNKLAESFQPPFSFTWINLPPGHHLLTAVALDNVGALATSAPVAFSASLSALLTVDDRSVVEGNTGTNALFTISLSSPSCRTVSVEVLTVDGTALAGSDYLSIRTNLTFYPDQTVKTLSIPIVGDSSIEPNEVFFVCLTNQSNASLSKPCGLGIIINDDTNEPPTVTIVSPPSGTLFYAPPGIVPILANASDSDGFVRQVEFYSGSVLIGRSTNGLFSFQWTNQIPGIYNLTAVATDNDTARGTSAPVTIIITGCAGTLTAVGPFDQIACACSPAILSTTISNSVSSEPISIIWRRDARLLPGQTNPTLLIESPASADGGNYSVEIRTPCKAITNHATLTVLGENLPNPLVLSSTNRIVINDVGPATPYPASINVSCVPGSIQKLTVTFRALRHGFPGDIDALLRSPSGQALKLMSDVGEDPLDLSDLTLTFDSAATIRLPLHGAFGSGTYLPTDYNEDPNSPDRFEALPTPTTFITNLTEFNSTDPNGPWSLYVVDDANADGGAIDGGWSLSIWWDDILPRLTAPLLTTGNQLRMTLIGQANRTHTIEGSTDLQHWIPIRTTVMTGTSIQVTLNDRASYPYRFYRARRCPQSDIFQSEAPRLSSPKFLGNGWFQMKLTSVPGRTHAIEASSDLQQWVRVSTNTMTGPAMPIIVPGANPQSRRFYRAVTLP